MHQAQLFQTPRRDRLPPRKLMHVCDAGHSGCCDSSGTSIEVVRFHCGRCDHESDWQSMKVIEAKRGIPCPNCNPI